MFSGITQGVFPVTSIYRQPGLLRYTVDLSPLLLKNLKKGASVSIDGVCQTVVDISKMSVLFEAIQETLDRTTLNDLSLGQLVSVERSLCLGDEIGGHMVSGHVYGVATLLECIQKIESLSLVLHCKPAWMKYISPKGFIAVDGSSLTVGETVPTKGLFSIHLIPETLRLTNFMHKKEGDRLNIEFDTQTKLIVDTVERILNK